MRDIKIIKEAIKNLELLKTVLLNKEGQREVECKFTVDELNKITNLLDSDAYRRNTMHTTPLEESLRSKTLKYLDKELLT